MTPHQALKEIFSRSPLPDGVSQNHRKRWKENKLKETAICAILRKAGYEIEFIVNLKNTKDLINNTNPD